jgi:hypothetical protein
MPSVFCSSSAPATLAALARFHLTLDALLSGFLRISAGCLSVVGVMKNRAKAQYFGQISIGML